MSWSGFKKNVSRGTTTLMMKTGHVERTSDREYEVEERRYRTLESAALRLQKEAKGYLDSLRAMTASQMRIAETIDAFYGDSGATDGVSRSYKQAVEDLDAETVKALDGPYRCVSQDPRLESMVFDEDTGVYNYSIVEEIEKELNFKAGNRRNFTRDVHSRKVKKGDKLIEFCYRTTVLEPINRFCAYFPDINECIKKRNHKMLDYDAMRSKVKKLVEKPDKDPSKLPRTEKETEMVKSASDFVHASRLYSEDSPTQHDEVLSFSTPPKGLDGLKHDQEDSGKGSVRVRRSSTVMGRVSRASSLLKNTLLDVAFGERIDESPELPQGPGDAHFPLRSPIITTTPPSSTRHSGHFDTLPVLREASKEVFDLTVPINPTGLSHLTPNLQRVLATPTRHSTLAIQPTRESRALSPLQLFSSTNRNSLSPSLRSSSRDTQRSTSVSSRGGTQRSSSVNSRRETQRSASVNSRKTTSSHKDSADSTRPLLARNKSSSRKASADSTRPTLRVSVPHPFFQPSELEDIMAPFRQKFAEEQADLMEQAKAAYEQLNQQLTDELPQLIDLRVPYLDPSFEALVKIQLRFCAEAYSRMAQVQQYLDASTRDQDASGDLDARVEDVLGQIRELSIAGTV